MGLSERLPDSPIPEEGCGVEERSTGAGAVLRGKTDDDRRRILKVGGQVFHDLEAPLHKPSPEEQVPGRAPGQGELRGHDQVRPGVCCLLDTCCYQVGIAGKVSDDCVHLEECDLHLS